MSYLALEDSLSGSTSESTDEGSDIESHKKLATLLSCTWLKPVPDLLHPLNGASH